MNAMESQNFDSSAFENRRILTIDDNRAIHEDYRKVLGGSQPSNASLDDAEELLFGEPKAKVAANVNAGYEIDSAYQGQEGFELVQRSLEAGRPYSVAFIDVRMPPGWDGIETARRIWEIDPAIHVVICTAYSDHSWEQIVEQLGRTEQFLILKKPFDNVEVRQLAAALVEKWRLGRLASLRIEELDRLVEQRTQDIAATRDMTVFALAKIADSRDPETGEHLERMRTYSQMLALWLNENGPYQEQIDETFLNQLFHSSPLHDIGKVGIPDSILLKPGRLTPDEFEEMKRHTKIGAEALEQAANLSSCGVFLKMAAEVAQYHHERFDGSGYPNGISGLEIPLSARIVALADVFDALTSARVYKDAMEPELAKEMIEAESGRHFDPVVVDAFVACYEEFARLAKAPAPETPLTVPGSVTLATPPLTSMPTMPVLGATT